MRGWIEWIFEQVKRFRRGLLIILGIVTAYVLLIVAVFLWNPRPSRTIDDPAFEKAANALCEKRVRPLAEQRRSGGDESADTPKANAAKIERVVEKLEAAVVELRALPHQPQYDDEIDAWFAEFDAFIEAGRNYADALRTEDEAVYMAADDESEAPHEAISDFARANHIDACNP